MAHLHSLAPPLASPPKPNYASSRLLPSHPTKFPPTPVFSSMNAPSRFEASLLDLEVSGTLPPSLSGTFFRIQPDARFPPLFADDIHFNGDGAVTAIRLHAGHADLLHRYVRTDRYIAETAARRALFGRYRNPFTDDEGVRGVVRTASNTNVVFWRGTLLAMKEDGPPFAMDPETLETVGRWDFEGQVGVPTVAAHPKVDPATGEMVCFAYECGGDGADGSEEVAVWTVEGEGGRVVEMAWYTAPFAGMIHDVGVSGNWVVLPLTPLKVDVERMRRGGNKFAWDPEEDQWYGVVPRRGGRREDIVWFRADNGEFWGGSGGKGLC